jgi:alpha-tubulin suppressor-like RCC1 family protein
MGVLGILALGGPRGWLGPIAGTQVAPPPPDAGAEAAVPTGPPRLILIQGDGQEGWPTSPLGQSVVFRVEDAEGSPLPEVPVRFQVASGGGMVSPSRTVTNDDGFVAAQWTLGPGLSPQSLEARVEDQEETTLTLTARALDPTPTQVQVLSGSGQQTEDGTVLPTSFRVRVVDAGDRGIPGVGLVFEATGEGGEVVPDSTTTDSAGVAEVRWTLGSARGPQEVVARVAGMEGVQATFQAEAVEAGLPPRPGVLAGARHTCALTSDGSLRCWGDGGSAPGAAVGARPFSRLALGGSHSCALDRDGQAYCWGGNDHGQLGDGSSTRRTEAVPVRGDLPPLLDIHAGAAHTCALTTGGQIYCWGANVVGQLGDDSHVSRAVPGPVASGLEFASLSTGWHHTCALERDGRAHCWGSNREEQLGRFATHEILRPRPVGGGHRFRKLATGEGHTCGLRSNGALLCWGANDYGQLGTGSIEGGWEPRPVRAEEPFREAVVGARFTCGIGWSGEAYCWGQNEHGQLGDGTRSDRREPVRVAGSFTFSQLHAGREHACGTTSEGDLLCWGRNNDGQLGDGTRTDRSAPVRVGGNPDGA